MSDLLNYIPEPEHASVIKDSPDKPPRTAKKAIFIPAVGAVLAFIALLGLLFSAPSAFPKDQIITVESGETLSGVTQELFSKEAIRSPFFFKALVTLFGGTKGLVAGDYLLGSKQNAVTLAWRFSHGSYGLESVKITFPEGTSSREMADALARNGKFVHFDKAKFVELAAPHEGYLFPDTYFFLPSVRAEEVVNAMLRDYDTRIKTVAADIQSFGKSEEEIIKMASIVEKEARTDQSRRIVAGILWKRLSEGMPLQVDATFALVNGKKASSDLTLEDLKTDSPYNTYVYKGLPPTPISNPGIAAIEATVHPTATPYYFYLSDKKGEMHYAVTHEEHLENKARYLE